MRGQDASGRSTAEALATAQGERVERALWTAYRTLEEHAEMAGQMAAVADRHANAAMSRRHAAIRREAVEAAATLRALLLSRPGPESGRTRSPAPHGEVHRGALRVVRRRVQAG